MIAFDPAACAALVDELTAIAILATKAIWDAKDDAVRIKDDGSPVTAADESAEAVIRERLARLPTPLPVIAEEQAEHERPTISGASYFLVDPLDGTREFVAGRAEYTVNIGLVANGIPILGVIAAPALGIIWRGSLKNGAERLTFSAYEAGKPEAIRACPMPPTAPRVLVSRSHLDARTKAYLAGLPRAEEVPCGSSLKFCRVAEGSADLYPRFGPTRDWDIAAGHAILTAAGGSVLTPEGVPLAYGTPKLLIPAFIASGAPARA